MFSELPKSLQEEVLYHLQNDNFVRAKAIHDEWMSKKQKQSSFDLDKTKQN